MNIFNRTFLGIYSLIWFGACVGLIAMAWNTGQQLDIGIGNFNVQAFIVSDAADRWIFTILIGLLACVGLITFFTAFRHATVSGARTIRARREDGAIVDVDARVAETMLRDELEMLPHVQQANPVIRTRNGIVETQIAVSMDPDGGIADLAAAVSETTGVVLKQQIGAVQVRRPAIHITYEEVSARPAGRPARRPEHAGHSAGLPPPPPPAPYAGSSRPGPVPPPPQPDGSVLPPPPGPTRTAPLVWSPPENPARPSERHEAERHWHEPADIEAEEPVPLPPPPPVGDENSNTEEDHRA